MYRMHVTVFVRRAFRHNAHLRYTYPVYPMTPTQVEESQTGGTSPSSSVMRTSATTMQPVDVRTTGDSEVCDDALVCTPIPLHHYSILGYLAPSCDFPTLCSLASCDDSYAILNGHRHRWIHPRRRKKQRRRASRQPRR